MKTSKSGKTTNRAGVKRKEARIVPTAKQKAAAIALSNNIQPGKPVRLQSEILREVGYSETMSYKVAEITESRGFLAALEEVGATDFHIASTYKDAMRANRVATIDGTPVETDIPDHAIRLKAADSVARLKGYTPEKQQGASGNTYNTFVQQNNIDPNSPESQSIVDMTLTMLMQQTERSE